MVGTTTTIAWLSDLKRSKTTADNHRRTAETLGILSFDTAKSISRLISLYKSLSDEEINRLKKHVIRGRGISYLTSDDAGFLLTLACAERLEDLDRSAGAVARLGRKCSDYGLVRFDQVYKDLKKGYVEMEKLDYGSRKMEKSMDKMEKLMCLTGDLYAALEALSELEASERKLNEWKKKNSNPNANYDLFDEKMFNQRKLVRHLKEVSLWSQSHDKIVGLMARTVCVLYARICSLFGPYLPIRNTAHNNKLFESPLPQTSMSGPIQSPNPKVVPLIRFLSRDSNVFLTHELGFQHHKTKVFQAAPPSTVGGSGLAMRYANVILLAERYLNTQSLIGDQARDHLYNMLPTTLKTYVRSKLRLAWRETTEEEAIGGDALAEGWREAMNGILEWLVPMAEDTLTWQAERNLEKQRFDSKPTVLLLQTLHYANLEKTEAAIAEVLVGLSCVYWYENRRLSCVDIY